MREFDSFGSAGEIDAAEHSAPSHSKKVIAGPTYFTPHSSGVRSGDPINGVVAGASASLSLVQGKAYRVIADVAVYFRLSAEASTALVGDIYLPKDTPIIIKADPWLVLSFIQATAGGKIQAVEVR